MPNELINRHDILSVATRTRLYLRHFARGYYPTDGDASSMPVNRLFIPLRNTEGDANYIDDAREHFTLQDRTLYFIPAFHTAKIRLSKNLFFLSVQCNLEIFPGVDFFSSCKEIRVFPHLEEIAVLLKIFACASEEIYLSTLQMQNIVANLLFRVAVTYPAQAFQTPLSLRHYMELTKYLEQNGDALTRVPELAKIAGQSREVFTRHFTAIAGITPKQLITRTVIGKCLDLLERGYSSKEITNKLNFSNEFVFSRFFKLNVGESPLQWKKHHLSQKHQFNQLTTEW